MEFTLLLMPKDFTIDRIETISDAVMQGGVILDRVYGGLEENVANAKPQAAVKTARPLN
jgi:hypothetical protein